LSMVRWIVGDIVEAVGGELTSGSSDTQIHGISTDTRTLKKGDLFVALKGDRFDGHDFLHEAVGRGAAAVMVSEAAALVEPAVAAVVVDDTLSGLQRFARWHRLSFDIPVIGVTGSCGKTTVKELIAAVLGTTFRVTRNPLSFNNEVGVPLSLLEISAETQVAVIELGTNAPGEMKALCDIARPNKALLTNVGRAHLEGFGTLEAVAKEKGALVEAVGDRGTFYVNVDNPFCVRIAQAFAGTCVTYGTGESAAWRATEMESKLDAAGSTFTVEPLGPLTVPLLGAHNVMNALAAVAVGADFGLSRDKIQEGLDGAETPPMRMRTVRIGDRVFLNDAYNANPESMRAAIEALVSWEGAGRRIAVLGDMLELGEASASEHKELGRIAARKGVDLVLVLGQFAQNVAEGATGESMNDDALTVCKDHTDAARLLVSLSAPGDAILVKGSRAVAMEKVLEEFDSLLA
jgi:UDP-N-acetylmuramoyl-tripeptide--D-alanyl-D-alanine ligase